MDDVSIATRIQEVILEFTSFDASKVMYREVALPMPGDYVLAFSINKIEDLHLHPMNIEDKLVYLVRVTFTVFCFGHTSKTGMLSCKNILHKGHKSNFMQKLGVMWQSIYENDVQSVVKADGDVIPVPNYSCAMDMWFIGEDIIPEIASSITIRDNIYPDTTYQLGGG